MKHSLLSNILSLTMAIDQRHPYTYYHSQKVAYLSRLIAQEMKLSKKECETIFIAGLLHDIGKILTPKNILDKPGQLTSEEFEIIKRHPEDGYLIITQFQQLTRKGIDLIVRYHHERVDGKGYPLGLVGSDIPLGARIVAVADTFDAITHDRSYRKAQKSKIAISDLSRGKGLNGI